MQSMNLDPISEAYLKVFEENFPRKKKPKERKENDIERKAQEVSVPIISAKTSKSTQLVLSGRLSRSQAMRSLYKEYEAVQNSTDDCRFTPQEWRRVKIKNYPHILDMHSRPQYNRLVDTTFQGLGLGDAVTICGSRHENQDRTISGIIKVGKEEISYFGLFDGHGGSQCADYLVANFPIALEKELVNLREAGYSLRNSAKIFEILESIFDVLSEEYRKSMFGKRSIRDYPGSTAIVCVKIKGFIYVANVGDSQGILCRGNETIILSEAAKPTKPRFVKDVVHLGGRVEYWCDDYRITSITDTTGINMTHAVGHPSNSGISSKAHIVAIPLHTLKMKNGQNEDNILLLASDGLSDVVRPKTVGETIRRIITDHRERYINSPVKKRRETRLTKRIAGILAKKAYLLNPEYSDNITVLAVNIKRDREKRESKQKESKKNK